MLASEGIDTILNPVLYLVDFESHNLAYKGIISVPLWLSVEIYRVLCVLGEHKTLESNARVALFILSIQHLVGHPIDISIIML